MLYWQNEKVIPRRYRALRISIQRNLGIIYSLENNTMNRKQHLIIRITALLLLSVMALGISGCFYNPKPIYPEDTGIKYLKFVAATGNKEHDNCIFISNDYGEYGEERSNYLQLTSDTAYELIEEVTALPDVYGDESEPFAYYISLDYYDENKNLVSLDKYGYGGFPENWSDIVAHTNYLAVKERETLTDSTDIVEINGDLLRKEFGITDEMLPEGVTVDKFAEDSSFTYRDLYEEGYFPKDFYISEYCYNYYDFKQYKITKDSVAAASDSKALKEYAEPRLDDITSESDISIIGKVSGQYFEIVRFDCFDEWKTLNDISESGIVTNDDQTLDIRRSVILQQEGMLGTDSRLIFVDPSNRFLIIISGATYPDYNFLYDFINS